MVRNVQGKTKKMSPYSVEKNKTTEMLHFQHNWSLSYQTGVSLKKTVAAINFNPVKKKKKWTVEPVSGGKGTVENYNCSARLTGGRLQPMGGRSLPLTRSWSDLPRDVWPTQAGGKPFATVNHVGGQQSVWISESHQTPGPSPLVAQTSPSTLQIWLSARLPTHILRLRLQHSTLFSCVCICLHDIHPSPIYIEYLRLDNETKSWRASARTDRRRGQMHGDAADLQHAITV